MPPVASYTLSGGSTQAYPYPVPNGTPVGVTEAEGGPNPAYATQRLNAANGYGSPAYSVTQDRPGMGQTPDPERLGDFPVIDYRGDVSQLDRYYAGRDADNKARASRNLDPAPTMDESAFRGTDSNGLRFALNPNVVPAGNIRVTQSHAPSGPQFIRAFGNGMDGTPKANARHLNGWHFSMADHRRNFEIFGMTPRKNWRTIQSETPAPWGEYIVDVPNSSQPVQAVTTQNSTGYVDGGIQSFMLT